MQGWLKKQSQMKSALKISEDLFKCTPMIDSWCLIELAQFINNKCNIRPCMKQILKRAKSTLVKLRVCKQRTVIQLQLTTANHGRSCRFGVLKVKGERGDPAHIGTQMRKNNTLRRLMDLNAKKVAQGAKVIQRKQRLQFASYKVNQSR